MNEANVAMPRAGGGAAGLTVLLVEDDRLSAAHGKHLLEKAGCATRVASGGSEALALLASERCDAAFFDIELPDTDGFELLRAFRDSRPGATRTTIPVYALTGHSPESIRDRAREAGFVAVLGKPLHFEELQSLISGLPPTPPSRPKASGILREMDPALASQFVTIFLEETPRQLAALRKAAADGDAGALRHVAHSLKSTSAMVDASSASQAALLLEQAASEGRLDECAELLLNLERELNAVQSSLQS